VIPSVFLDSGIFIAFLNGRDQWHPATVALFDGPRPPWRTSLLVVSESYSWFLHQMGEESARRFRAFLNDLQGLVIYEPAASHQAQVWKMLDRYRGSKLTYVDASSLCFMESHNIRQVWSTDHHLGLSGADVLPRV
jgi:predicted nucleic acid-binding protein